jgi:uncharacterized coiled-coil DUF342 family protein
MRRFLLAIAVLAMTVVPASCQNAPTDSQSLRAILEEIRQLRRDLQTTAVATQRVQITLYRLQLQDAAVARAMKFAEEAHSKLAETTAERNRVAARIDQFASVLDGGTNNASERREIEQALPELKRRLDQLGKDEDRLQSKVSEAENQLTNAEAKLAALQDLLDQLDQALQSVGHTREDTSRK